MSTLLDKYLCSVTESCPTLCKPLDYCLPVFSMGFFRQEYWHGLLFPSPGYLPYLEVKITSPVPPAL